MVFWMLLLFVKGGILIVVTPLNTLCEQSSKKITYRDASQRVSGEIRKTFRASRSGELEGGLGAEKGNYGIGMSHYLLVTRY